MDVIRDNISDLWNLVTKYYLWFLIMIVVVLIYDISQLETFKIREFFQTGWGRLKTLRALRGAGAILKRWFQFSATEDSDNGHHRYDNLCLTQDPYYNHQQTYDFWRRFPQRYQQQYQTCDRYGCPSLGVSPQPHESQTTLASDVTQATSPELPYYENPTLYCQAHPERYPCPNSWKPSEITTARTLPVSHPKFKVSPQIQTIYNTQGHCVNQESSLLLGKDCPLIDGDPALLFIKPHREDHATC